MEIEEFALGNSWVHNLDPRVKIVVTLLFSFVVALNRHLPDAALSLLLPVTLLAAARLSVRTVLARLAIVNGFILFIWFFLPFTVSGETIYLDRASEQNEKPRCS